MQTFAYRRLVVALIATAFLAMVMILWSGQALLSQNTLYGASQNEDSFKQVGVDYEGAKQYLDKYKRLFANKSQVVLPADPSKPWTVTKWWQAAALIQWYTESTPRYNCKNKKKFGNWAACMDPPYTIKPPCLVYSFGIAFDFSFDDAIAKHGCTVHSFDPSMETEDHQRNERVWFHNLGLSSHNTDRHLARRDPLYVKNSQTWKIRTLSSIKRMLGHSGKVIDVLKIDIEGFEWEVLENLMESGELSRVRQLSVEFHLFPKSPPREDYVNLYKMYTRLREEFGFLEYTVGPHPFNIKLEQYNVQGDSQFVNSRYSITGSPL